MRLRKQIARLVISSALAIGAVPALVAQERNPDADNTKQNQRDRDNSEPTADRAKNNLSDREMMKQIRKAVMEDKSLSTYAHNVKIIAQNGKVSLKGPVRSEEEKHLIEQKATDVAGSGNVTNEITIKPARDK